MVLTGGASGTPAGPAPVPSAARSRSRAIWPALWMLGYFLVVGAVCWRLDGSPGQFVFFALIGAATGGGFLLHARLRPARERVGRTVSLWVVGLSLFLGAGVFGRQSFQIEGFFFHVFAGVAGGVVTHYLVAKILGPLFIGRAWCGWGCWIWMGLDRLPWRRSPGPRPGWSRWRLGHFAASLSLVAGLVWGAGYDHGFTWATSDGMWWFLGGCAVYYAAGIGLAAAVRDNRAFCKSLCPVSVFLRAGNRVSLLKVTGARETCGQCGACDRVCPMDVPVSAFVAAGTRVLDPDCTLCQSCLSVCPRGNLRLSLGFDLSRDSRPGLRPPGA